MVVGPGRASRLEYQRGHVPAAEAHAGTDQPSTVAPVFATPDHRYHAVRVVPAHR